MQREAPANTVLEQDPPRPADASLDCAFLSFFCSKPKVALTVSAGPGSAKVPGDRRPEPGRSGRRSWKRPASSAQVEKVNSDQVEEGLVIHSDPSGGSTATRGSTVVLTVSNGPKLAKVPVLVGTQRSRRGAADPRPRPHPERRRRGKREAGGRGDPPGAERRLRAAARLDRLDRRLQGRRKATVPNVIGKERRGGGRSAARSRPRPDRVSEQETEVPSQVGTGHRPVPAAGLGSRTGGTAW